MTGKRLGSGTGTGRRREASTGPSNVEYASAAAPRRMAPRTSSAVFLYSDNLNVLGHKHCRKYPNLDKYPIALLKGPDLKGNLSFIIHYALHLVLTDEETALCGGPGHDDECYEEEHGDKLEDCEGLLAVDKVTEPHNDDPHGHEYVPTQ